MIRAVLLAALLAPLARADKRAPARELVVDVELLDPPRPVPGAGSTHIASVGRFRVLRVTRGAYPHTILLAGFDQATGLPTVAGARYRLTLTDRFPRTASLLNPFAAEALALGTFYCTVLQRIP